MAVENLRPRVHQEVLLHHEDLPTRQAGGNESPPPVCDDPKVLLARDHGVLVIPRGNYVEVLVRGMRRRLVLTLGVLASPPNSLSYHGPLLWALSWGTPYIPWTTQGRGFRTPLKEDIINYKGPCHLTEKLSERHLQI